MEPLSPETFRFALDNTVDAVTITDIDSVIQYINPAFTAITGFTAEEVIGKKPNIQRSPKTTGDTYKAMWEVILQGGWWRGEIVNLRKNGEEWHSLLSISQVRDAQGRPVAYVGIARDITPMKQLQLRLKQAGLEAIFMLAAAAEAKDEVTGSHLQRVQNYSHALALKLGFSGEQAEEIGYSSMMHDVGKIHVPDSILKKIGYLTEEEWKGMREHPNHGVAILRKDPFFETAREIAGNHHEKWDGTGYPLGKAGPEIPLASRIVTVADVFDALTTARPYKRAWSEKEALQEIINLKGRAFDPAVVDAFVRIYEEGLVDAILDRFPPNT